MLTLASGPPGLLFGRREFLRVGGGLAVAGLTLPLEAAQPAAATAAPLAFGPRTGKARACILVYLLGGPSHIDTFDLKPRAPSECRGPFRPMATTVPGTQICEHLPLLAGRADKYALVRSVSHRNSNHTPMIYYTLTGRHTDQPERDNDIRPPQRSDFPHLGSVVARHRGGPAGLPGCVALPELAIRSSIRGEYRRARSPLRGGGAGFLGPKYEPLAVNGEPGTAGAIPSLSLAPDVSPERFERRAALLSLLDRRGPSSSETSTLAGLRQQAVVMTGAATGGGLDAFSLAGESPRLRDRYGRHRFGQSMLLARRLAEAGVPLVAIHFNEMTVCDGWDTHSKNFEALQGELLPMLDQGLSALLDDLDQRGRLADTLVVCLGEFGRTPKINPNAGRDHWGECSTALLAGGGIRGGQTVGASDKIAATPVSRPVDPVDIQATIYHCLGLDPRASVVDHFGRPWPITAGRAVRELL